MVNIRIVKIILIIFLFVVIIGIRLNGKDRNCDNCLAKFKNTAVQGVDLDSNVLNTSITVKVKDLFDNYENGSCLIYWSRTNGYQKG